MRTLAELDELPASEWTEEEALAHLSATFDAAAKQFPDLLEPYVVLLVEANTSADKLSIMRRGLRETLTRRHPYPETVIAADRMRRAERLGAVADRLSEQQAAE